MPNVFKDDDVHIESTMYTEAQVQEIFEHSGLTRAEIEKNYTLNELREMYIAIYKHRASSSKNKHYIVSYISEYFSGISRAKAFFN